MFVVDVSKSTTDNPDVTGAQEIMQDNIINSGSSSVIVDDTGITMTVDLTDPSASASLAFASSGPWVTDPCSYGAMLSTAGGFSESGIIPSSDWLVTTIGTTETAFLSWIAYDGAPGVPFDNATIMPDASAFPDPNDTYEYEIGSFGGAYSNIWVPEPSSLGLLSSALAAILALVRRKVFLCANKVRLLA
jgi:hypothetical protein